MWSLTKFIWIYVKYKHLPTNWQLYRGTYITFASAMWIRQPTLALKPRGDVTRNQKQGYQWPQKWTCVRQKLLKKKEKKVTTVKRVDVNTSSNWEPSTFQFYAFVEASRVLLFTDSFSFPFGMWLRQWSLRLNSFSLYWKCSWIPMTWRHYEPARYFHMQICQEMVRWCAFAKPNNWNICNVMFKVVLVMGLTYIIFRK